MIDINILNSLWKEAKSQIFGKYEKKKRNYKKTYQYTLIFQKPMSISKLAKSMKLLEISDDLISIRDEQDKKDVFGSTFYIK